MTLTIDCETSERTTTLRIRGTMDISTIDRFREQSEQAFEMPGEERTLVVDFEGLEFIDSTGIGMIVELLHRSRDHGYAMEFQGIREEIADIFETIGILRILEAFSKGASR